MSKTVGYVLTAALVVFAIAVPIIGPTALAAWGFSAGTVAAIGAALSAAVIVNSLLMPKPKSSNNAQETTLQLGEVARRALFGKSATAGSLVDVFNYGGKYGTDHEVVIFALADHYCEELVGVYVNDVFVPWVGDGNYAQFDTHHLSMYFRNGSEIQTLPSVVTTNGPGWTSDDTGAGICYAVVDYLADSPTAKHPAWPGGRPTFLWVVKGKRCYDPRLDTTVGGSGSHRWQDPSTWEWSENPIVCHYNYERGVYACDRVDQPSMLLVGRGLTATEVPPANIFANANLCDEVMADTLARYTTGGIVAADEKFLDVAEKFAAACGGIIIQPEGSVEIEPAQARTPSFAFTDDDLLVGSTVEWNEGILSEADSEWLNTIVPRYVSPDQKWGDHAAPVRRVDADLITDGGPREEDVVLQLVTVERQASDVGEIHRKMGRLFGRGKVALPPRFAEIEEGDWGTWTSARRFGGDTKTFRVESYALDGKWQNALSLREINSAVYDGVLGAGSSAGSAGTWDTTTPPIDIGTPDSGNWSLTAVTLTSTDASVPALEISGDNTDDTSAEAIIIEYWKSDGVINPTTDPDAPPWIMEGAHPPSTTKVDITSIQGGASYYAAVTYVVSGIPGDRLVLGPVTAGTLSAAVSDGDKGDITVSGSGATFTIDNDVVTFAKMQNIANKRVIGRNTASSGDPEEVTVDQLLDWIAGTAAQGDVFFRGASGIKRLAAGTSGQFLQTLGAGVDPSWASGISGSGAWSLIATSTATGVTHVDFTNLAGYSDLLLIGIGVTGSASSFRGIAVSTDNGSTFFTTSGNYIRPTTSGVPSNVVQFDMVDASSAAALSFAGLIQGINVNGVPKRCSSSSQLECIFKGSLSPVNAIRYAHSTAGNITGGTLYLLGR
jgi:hypothetical protein